MATGKLIGEYGDATDLLHGLQEQGAESQRELPDATVEAAVTDASADDVAASWAAVRPAPKVAGGYVGGGAAQDSELSLAYRADTSGAQDWTALVSQQWQAFRQGYRDFGGNIAWEDHFVYDVLPCESGSWAGWYQNGYVSRAQFHVLSWSSAVRATGLDRPDDPYAVGGNVAWWSNAIDHPGGSGGWPSCWWEGVVP